MSRKIRLIGVPVLLAILLIPDTFRESWELALVLFAAFFLVPAGLKLINMPLHRGYQMVVFPALAAAIGCRNSPACLPGLWATPYLVFAAWMTVNQWVATILKPDRQLRDWLRVFALGYWTTGAFWLFCAVWQIRPLGFDPVLVRLTATHFHLAGFVLTVVIFCLLEMENNRFHRTLAAGALGGMPLVAAGITSTRLGGPGVFEMLTGAGFALMALALAGQQVRLSFRSSLPSGAREVWKLAGLSLMAGALLAAVYALRFVWPLASINIPNMKIWHGTLNTLGFGWFALEGWKEYKFGRESPAMPAGA